jgi:hypothetical protein
MKRRSKRKISPTADQSVIFFGFNGKEQLKNLKKSKERELKKEMQSASQIEENLKKLEAMKGGNHSKGHIVASNSQKHRILKEKERRKHEAQVRREEELVRFFWSKEISKRSETTL